MEHLRPYVVFLPRERKQKILRAIFGSKVSLEILFYSIRQGLSKKIYQKDLIKSLGNSNKTVISYLKTLTELGVLTEYMEKEESGGRTTWMKVYRVSDLGRWFALLLVEEKKLSREEKTEIVLIASKAYIEWIKKLYDSLELKREILRELVDSDQIEKQHRPLEDLN